MSTIYLITKTGPEWQDPVEAWLTKRSAVTRAEALNESLQGSKDIRDQLSRHEVVPIPLKGKQ